MTIIKWRDSYETGIEAMDNEHKKIIVIINQLYQMQRDKKSFDELKVIYQSLVEYTEQHFQHEEQLLDEAGYPELGQQRASHVVFVQKLSEMEKDLLAAKESAVPVVYKYLRQWWLDHIVGEDKLYGPFLQK